MWARCGQVDVVLNRCRNVRPLHPWGDSPQERRPNVGPPLGAGSLGGVARTAILTNVWGGDLCQRPRDGNCNNPAHRSSLAADPLTQKRQFGPAGLSDE